MEKQEKQLAQVPADIKKKSLESALYQLTKHNNFLGNLITELNIRYDVTVPTALIVYNKNKHQFEIRLGTHYFCNHELPQRVAILHHEIRHFTHQHLFRYQTEGKPKEDHKIFNIAADMAINQYISNLPEGTVNVEDWKLPNGQPFPKWRVWEEYYELLKKDHQENSKEGGGKSPNKEMWDKYSQGNNFDEHEWEEMSEEDKERMLSEAKKALKRTIEKTSYGYNTVPDYINELINEIETELNKLDYKGILKKAIKRSVSCIDRESTWKKSNKRYGMYAPGTTLGKLPKLDIFCDTSGSISWIEFNKFLSVMDGFLKVGTRQCMFGMWHTDLYHFEKYKLGSRVTENDIQQGGTDVGPVLEMIKKRDSDLAIILTDGYFGAHDIRIQGEVIWIISEDGQIDHPMRHIGKTIKLNGLIK